MSHKSLSASGPLLPSSLPPALTEYTVMTYVSHSCTIELFLMFQFQVKIQLLHSVFQDQGNTKVQIAYLHAVYSSATF